MHPSCSLSQISKDEESDEGEKWAHLLSNTVCTLLLQNCESVAREMTIGILQNPNLKYFLVDKAFTEDESSESDDTPLKAFSAYAVKLGGLP